MSNAEIEARPELILGPNPLLDRLPPFIPFSQIGERLDHRPLEGVPWAELRPELRVPLLQFSPRHYVPIETLLEPADAIQRLVRRSLVIMNPLDPRRRRLLIQRSTCDDLLGMLSWDSVDGLDGAGAVFAGMTGTGRSALIREMLHLIAPEQILEYGPSEACGWSRWLQVVYLCVDHPSNGTRGGWCKRVLGRLDAVAGTSYAKQHERTTNIDTLLCVVARLLLLHRVALLVVDEHQQKTFAESPWSLEFIIFYLLLMNLGISVLLSGNTMAFEHLLSYSQLVRRFSVGGIHHFFPALCPETPWWCNDFTPRMRTFSVMDKIDISPDVLAKIEHRDTGGVPGLYPLLYCAAQRSALRRNGETAVLRAEDFEVAKKDPTYRNALQIARAVYAPSLEHASRFIDIPDLPVKAPGSLGPFGVATGGANSTPPSDAQSSLDATVKRMNAHTLQAVKAIVRRYQAQHTRQLSGLISQFESMHLMSPKMLKALNIDSELIKGLEQAKSLAEVQQLQRGLRTGRSPRA